MTTRKVNAIIERASDGGYGVYCPDIEGTALCGYGRTEEEAKSDLLEVLEMNIERFQEINEPLPEGLNGGDIEFEYSYDFSGFFQSYPVFNVSELAKYIGINPSLLRRYKTGEKFASREQRKKIEEGIHALARNLSAVSF
ncbi:MAG: type II toxin-antitoxin system HicB family antitoxin [Mediterranea sp.]|jgi:predicted RNase H-like HicB family nuclease|nr:type II toxin-antitoxin system HicB family antitoxin [Mediterranea sp.]